MNCPKCESGTKVVNTREVQGKRQRKRLCSNGHFFYTAEVVLEKWGYIDPRIKHPGKGRATKTRMKKLNAIKFQKKTQRILADANTPDWVKEIYRKIQ